MAQRKKTRFNGCGMFVLGLTLLPHLAKGLAY